MQSTDESAVKAGIAWFVVGVAGSRNPFWARMQKEGYRALANAHLFDPAVAVADEGAAVGFSISGVNYFPSTGYALIGEGRQP